MDPEQQNQPVNDSNNTTPPDASYIREMQQIVNPIDPNQPSPTQSAPTNSADKSVKTANLISNLNLITWLLPAFGILISVFALMLGLKTKKYGDKRAQSRIILAIVGLVLSIACTGVIGYYLLTGDKSASSNTPSTLNTYPEEVRANYLSSCSIVFDETTCNCMLQGFENEYTVEEYQAEDAKVYDGTASDEYMLFLRDNQLNCEAEITPEPEE